MLPLGGFLGDQGVNVAPRGKPIVGWRQTIVNVFVLFVQRAWLS